MLVARYTYREAEEEIVPRFAKNKTIVVLTPAARTALHTETVVR